MSSGKRSAARDESSSRTAVERIILELREQILTGELNPDERLPTVPELSAHYNVSLNTARQALAVLASQGLLNVKRGVTGGSFVTVPTDAQITESWQTNLTLLTLNAGLPTAALAEIRDILEIQATEMAALRRTDDDLDAMRQCLVENAATSRPEVLASNRDFHTNLLKATQNPLFELVAGPIRTVLHRRLPLDHEPHDFRRWIDEGHREIFGFIERRDQAGARESMRAHLRAVRLYYEG